jgi:hypothetical protein
MYLKFLGIFVFNVVFWMGGCGNDETAPDSLATGGSMATGGSTQSGGTITASGGIQSKGGSVSGGSTSAGGQIGSGGKTITGGSFAGGATSGGKAGGAVTGGASSGGVTGSGGAVTGGTGSGGTTGSGGAATGGSTESCVVGPPLSGGTSHCSSNASGKLSGAYSWTIWSDGRAGCMITYNEGIAFKATWNESGDFLARTGLGWNSTQTYDQLGKLEAEFAFTKSGTGGPYSFIGIYGWSKNPLREYYIVEDWFTTPKPGNKVGTITVDGGVYTVYKYTRVNKPSIEGTKTFEQFFSVRETPRQCGHISITQHFDEWAKMGLTLGKMYEARILVEAGGGSGSVDFTKATLTAVK